MRYSIGAAIRGLDGLRWGAGTAVFFCVFSLCVIYTLRSPAEYVVSAFLKVEFVGAGNNAGSISPKRYATNGVGWGPLISEARLLKSEFVLRKALQLVNAGLEPQEVRRAGGPNSPEVVALARDQVKVRCEADGLRLRGVGSDPRAVASLVNAVAEVYRDERNEMAPAPPGCKKLLITLTERARPPSRPLYFARLSRFALGAAMYGVAVAWWFSRRSRGSESPLVATFLAWLALSLGAASLFTQLPLGLCLVGATVLAFMVATGAGCVALVTATPTPVHPTLLFYTFRAMWALLVGAAVFWLWIQPEKSQTGALVRVNALSAHGDEELGLSYDPRFVATECRLVESACILGSLDDQDSRKALAKHYGYDDPFTEKQARAWRRWQTRAEPVESTSLIKISHYGEKTVHTEPTALRIAQLYRDYWNARSSTNLTRRVQVVLLGAAGSPDRERLASEARYGMIIIEKMLSALIVLAGALCAALLARNPASLQVLLAIAIGYVIILGLAALVSALAPDSYSATCSVRFWPTPSAATQTTTGWRADSSWSPLRRECQLAVSEKVMSRACESLQSNPVFMRPQQGELRSWPKMNHSQRQSWIRQHLKVYPIANTLLMGFTASSDEGQSTADIANAVAAAFCEVRRARPQEATHGQDPAEVELMEPATAPAKPDAKSNPVMAGLKNGFGAFGLFMLGAAIGYLGFLVETIRARFARTSETP